MINQNEIIRALRLWFQPGDVFEVRVLDAVTRDYRREHVEDNIHTFSPLEPLTDAEHKVIAEALATYRKSGAVPCTACRYCSPCPIGVNIPRNLALLNLVRGGLSIFHAKLVYDEMSEDERADSCIGCGSCLKKCPQQIKIPTLMEQIVQEFK